jgi:aminoglycoside 6'-N-acetyltransferase
MSDGGASPHERIEGEVVSLRLLVESDLPDLVRWLSDPEVVQFYGEPPVSVDEARRDYIDPDVHPVWRFVIEHEGRGIGEIQYHHPYPGTEWEWSVGIDIFIGEPDARNRGLGAEAVRTLLRYLFEVKRCHIVTIDPEVANARAIRSYEQAGFRLDGVLRHHAFEHGEYVDTHFMSILESEWPDARARWEAERASRRATGA